MLIDTSKYLLDKNLVYVNTKNTVKNFRSVFERYVSENVNKKYECQIILDYLTKDINTYGNREVVWINLKAIQGNIVPTGYSLPIINNTSEFAYYIETTLSNALDIFNELNKE